MRPGAVDSLLRNVTVAERRAINKMPRRHKNRLNQLAKGILRSGSQRHAPLRLRVIQSSLTPAQKLEICEGLATSDVDSGYVQYAEAMMHLPRSIKPPSRRPLAEQLQRAQARLDECIHGQEELKDAIVEVLADRVTNPRSNAAPLGIQGPPGNGKTTIVRHGLAEIADVPFFTIALGGLSDATHLTGFERTWSNSTYGRLAQIAIQAQCTNMVIFWDELDKVSGTTKGKEILDLLVHLTDPEGCDAVTDRFLGPIDLTGATHVFAFNDVGAVPPVLLSRLRVITTQGYTDETKRAIVHEHILPELYEAHNLNIVVDDSYVAAAVERCKHEHGIRSLRQVIGASMQRAFTCMSTGGAVRLGVPDACLREGADGLRGVRLAFPDAKPLLDAVAPREASADGPQHMYT